MKLFDNLDEENFLLYAVKNYYNPTCIDADEFYQDLKRFKYIKRLITRYEESDVLSTNLVLNHLIVIFNVFGYDSGLKMIEYQLSESQLLIIKPFLIYLKVITNDKYIGKPMDRKIIEELRKI